MKPRMIVVVVVAVVLVAAFLFGQRSVTAQQGSPRFVTIAVQGLGNGYIGIVQDTAYRDRHLAATPAGDGNVGCFYVLHTPNGPAMMPTPQGMCW